MIWLFFFFNLKSLSKESTKLCLKSINSKNNYVFKEQYFLGGWLIFVIATVNMFDLFSKSL